MQLRIRYKPIGVMQAAILLCLFLATLNFINRYYYFVFIAFGLFCVSRSGQLRMYIPAGISLLVLALSWIIFAPGLTASVFNMVKPFTYVLCYIMGYTMSDTDSQNDKTEYNRFYVVICTVAAGSFLHYLLNWVANINTYDSRNVADIWTGTVIAATGQAAMACLPLALALAGIFSKSSQKIKIVSFGILAIVVGYNLILSGRTLFVLIIVVAAVAFLHRLVREQSGKIKTVLSMALLIAVIILAYRIDLFGIRTTVENSLFYDRFFGDRAIELDEDGRMDKKLYHLRHMLQYPFGGANIREQIGYAHDIYLDTYDEAGIFALLSLLFYIAQAIGSLWKCVSNKCIPFAVRQTVLCLYVLVLIEFMVEPILQGMPWFFASFCFIDGYVRRIVQQQTKRLESTHYENC